MGCRVRRRLRAPRGPDAERSEVWRLLGDDAHQLPALLLRTPVTQLGTQTAERRDKGARRAEASASPRARPQGGPGALSLACRLETGRPQPAAASAALVPIYSHIYRQAGGRQEAANGRAAPAGGAGRARGAEGGEGSGGRRKKLFQKSIGCLEECGRPLGKVHIWEQ